MKISAIVLVSIFYMAACSPPDEHSPSPAVIPERNQTKSLDNNASTPSKPEGNQTAAPTPRPATGLAGFLPGKQIDLKKVANDAIKLAPRFGADGTWTNALDPKQHGTYALEQDGQLILNLPDKKKMTLYISTESVKANDMVNVLVDDTLIQTTVEAIK